MIEYNESPKDRADIKAKEKLEYIKAVKQRALKLLYITIGLVTLSLILLAVGAWSAWENREEEWRTDYHHCYVKLGNTIVEGQRSYRYKATTVLGYRFLDKGNIVETTEIKSSSLQFRVVGIHDTTPWIHQNELTSKVMTKLKYSDNYVFITANNIEVVPYSSFCGIARPVE